MAQLVEHILGKDEVPGSNPGSSSKNPFDVSRRDFYLFPIPSSLFLKVCHRGDFWEGRGNSEEGRSNVAFRCSEKHFCYTS